MRIALNLAAGPLHLRKSAHTESSLQTILNQVHQDQLLLQFNIDLEF